MSASPVLPQSTPGDPDTPAAGAPEPGAPTATKRVAGRRWWIAGIGIAVLVVVVLAPLASSDPDGLERVAEDQGFIGQATNLVGGLLGDYAIPFLGDGAVSTIVSGLIGIAIVVGLLFLLGRLMARRRA